MHATRHGSQYPGQQRASFVLAAEGRDDRVLQDQAQGEPVLFLPTLAQVDPARALAKDLTPRAGVKERFPTDDGGRSIVRTVSWLTPNSAANSRSVRSGARAHSASRSEGDSGRGRARW